MNSNAELQGTQFGKGFSQSCELTQLSQDLMAGVQKKLEYDDDTPAKGVLVKVSKMVCGWKPSGGKGYYQRQKPDGGHVIEGLDGETYEMHGEVKVCTPKEKLAVEKKLSTQSKSSKGSKNAAAKKPASVPPPVLNEVFPKGARIQVMYPGKPLLGVVAEDGTDVMVKVHLDGEAKPRLVISTLTKYKLVPDERLKSEDESAFAESESESQPKKSVSQRKKRNSVPGETKPTTKLVKDDKVVVIYQNGAEHKGTVVTGEDAKFMLIKWKRLSGTVTSVDGTKKGMEINKLTEEQWESDDDSEHSSSSPPVPVARPRKHSTQSRAPPSDNSSESSCKATPKKEKAPKKRATPKAKLPESDDDSSSSSQAESAERSPTPKASGKQPEPDTSSESSSTSSEEAPKIATPCKMKRASKRKTPARNTSPPKKKGKLSVKKPPVEVDTDTDSDSEPEPEPEPSESLNPDLLPVNSWVGYKWGQNTYKASIVSHAKGGYMVQDEGTNSNPRYMALAGVCLWTEEDDRKREEQKATKKKATKPATKKSPAQKKKSPAPKKSPAQKRKRADSSSKSNGLTPSRDSGSPSPDKLNEKQHSSVKQDSTPMLSCANASESNMTQTQKPGPSLHKVFLIKLPDGGSILGKVVVDDGDRVKARMYQHVHGDAHVCPHSCAVWKEREVMEMEEHRWFDAGDLVESAFVVHESRLPFIYQARYKIEDGCLVPLPVEWDNTNIRYIRPRHRNGVKKIARVLQQEGTQAKVRYFNVSQGGACDNGCLVPSSRMLIETDEVKTVCVNSVLPDLIEVHTSAALSRAYYHRGYRIGEDNTLLQGTTPIEFRGRGRVVDDKVFFMSCMFDKKTYNAYECVKFMFKGEVQLGEIKSFYMKKDGKMVTDVIRLEANHKNEITPTGKQLLHISPAKILSLLTVQTGFCPIPYSIATNTPPGEPVYTYKERSADITCSMAGIHL